MACDEIKKAIDLLKQTMVGHQFSVTAYFTSHQGGLTNPGDSSAQPLTGRDYCWYATGGVQLNGGHLMGDLQLYTNTDATVPGGSGMKEAKNGTISLDIFPDGSAITFQQKINGKPVGPFPSTKVTTTCLGGVLLTGTTGQNEVITVGVRRNDVSDPK